MKTSFKHSNEQNETAIQMETKHKHELITLTEEFKKKELDFQQKLEEHQS